MSADTGYYSLKTGNLNYICSYNGNAWSQRQVSSFQNSLYFSNSRSGWSAGENGTIYKTTNAGNNWLQNYTPNNVHLNAIQFVNDQTGWAAGENGLIMKTTSSGITFVSGIGNTVPGAYSLSQNYPNPFNPETHFRFSIADPGLVKMTIYDALGSEVAVILDQQMQPGIYETDWDASAYPSGVYYYRLQVLRADYSKDVFTETRKMVLIK